MKNCTNCGNTLSNTATFCPRCGKRAPAFSGGSDGSVLSRLSSAGSGKAWVKFLRFFVWVRFVVICLAGIPAGGIFSYFLRADDLAELGWWLGVVCAIVVALFSTAETMVRLNQASDVSDIAAILAAEYKRKG